MIRYSVRSFANNKIYAIKLVRELALCGLKEAKDFVESQTGFFIRADAATQARAAQEAERLGIEFDPPLEGFVEPGPSIPDPTLMDGPGCSVRFVSGSQVINAIKLVRTITGLGLKEAKQVVDSSGMIRTGISQSDADEIARRFAEVGAIVTILASSQPGSGQRSSTREPDDDF